VRSQGGVENVFGSDTTYNDPASIIMNRLLGGMQLPSSLSGLVDSGSYAPAPPPPMAPAPPPTDARLYFNSRYG
jgi:hypothetical protein